jgi:hypothetical protein
MKHFVKDIADQVMLDVCPSGRLLAFNEVHVVDCGNKNIKVYLQGVINMDEENLIIHTATYTDDMEADEDLPEDWKEFDDSEIIYLEKHLQYS